MTHRKQQEKGTPIDHGESFAAPPGETTQNPIIGHWGKQAVKEQQREKNFFRQTKNSDLKMTCWGRVSLDEKKKNKEKNIGGGGVQHLTRKPLGCRKSEGEAGTGESDQMGGGTTKNDRF